MADISGGRAVVCRATELRASSGVCIVDRLMWASFCEDRSGRSCLWWRSDPRWGLKCDRRAVVRTVIGGTAANPSGRIADLRRSRRSASDSLRKYRADWLFGAVRWIDAGADYIIEHPPPKCLGHDADEGRAVSCASYVRSNPARKSVGQGKSVSVRVTIGG